MQRKLTTSRSAASSVAIGDLALASAGTQATLASSSYHRHPPEAAIDGSKHTYWLTTGCFPQTLCLSFATRVQVHKVRMVMRGVREFVIERSEEAAPFGGFVPVMSLSHLPEREGRLQVETHDVNRAAARHLRLVILDSWEPFVSVHSLSVHGTVAREE